MKQQRYVVKASQTDCYYFYPYTEDPKQIEINKEIAIRDCFIADFGRISGVETQDPTDFLTLEEQPLYEGDIVLFLKGTFEAECLIVKDKDLFYGEYTDSNNQTKRILMDESFDYVFQEEESSYSWEDDYACPNGCCACCGCSCGYYDGTYDDDEDQK